MQEKLPNRNGIRWPSFLDVTREQTAVFYKTEFTGLNSLSIHNQDNGLTEMSRFTEQFYFLGYNVVQSSESIDASEAYVASIFRIEE
jgi:hypothetical protein